MDQKYNLQKFREELANTPLDDLGYILGRYCGPHNQLLAEKKYGYEVAKQITRLVNDEIFTRHLDGILLVDSE